MSEHGQGSIVEIVLSGLEKCPHCRGPTVATLSASSTGYSAGSELRHTRKCPTNFCKHGKRVVGPYQEQDECQACDEEHERLAEENP